MNITTATPVSLPVNTANIPTEVVNTENRLAERVPESRKTFEYPPARRTESGPANNAGNQNTQEANNSQSRTVESKEEQQQGQQGSSGNPNPEQQERQEQAEIRQLASIDRKVRAHEQAHSSVGGVYAGAPSFTYKTGPNGVRYAVGGEVSIDVSPVPGNPEATLRKAEQVARAALAPADPSSVDRRVAASASALAAKARFEIAQRAAEASDNVFRNSDEDEQGPLPFNVAGTSFGGAQLKASLATDATEQVGGEVSASA